MSMMKKLVKDLEEGLKIYRDGGTITYGFQDSIELAIGTIKELSEKLHNLQMERSSQYYNSGWIPCNERLPDNNKDVLVWFEYYRYGDYNKHFQTIGISYMYKGEWSGFVNDSSGWRDLKIIAWMPLPEPFKGNEETK